MLRVGACVDGGRMGNGVSDRESDSLRRRHVLRHLRVGREAAVGRSSRGRRRHNTTITTASATAARTAAASRRPCVSTGRDVILRRDDRAGRALPDQGRDGADTDCTAGRHLSERIRPRTQSIEDTYDHVSMAVALVKRADPDGEYTRGEHDIVRDHTDDTR